MVGLTKRLVGLVAAAALVAGGLTGCGPAEPKNAQELMERTTALEDRDNFHSDATIDLSVELFGQTMPMSIDMAMDVAGDSSHGTTSTSLFGEDITSEVYVVKEGDDYVQYTSVEDGDDVSWTKSKTDSMTLAQDITNEQAALFEDAEFTATDDGYELVIPGEKLMAFLGESGSLDSLDELVGDSSDALKDTTATLTFGKDYHLTSLDYAVTIDTADTQDVDESGFNLSVSMNMSIKMTFSDYGTIDPESVVVPDDVKEKAFDTDQFGDEVGNLVNELVDTADEEATEELDQAA